jgi:transcriptional regulator with XRE-family HTH domain
VRIAAVETRRNIGTIIREKRIEKGIPQSELCSDAKITQTFLSLIENGKRIPSQEVVNKIAMVLKEDPKNLLDMATDYDFDVEERLTILFKQLLKKQDKNEMNKLIKLLEKMGK